MHLGTGKYVVEADRFYSTTINTLTNKVLFIKQDDNHIMYNFPLFPLFMPVFA